MDAIFNLTREYAPQAFELLLDNGNTVHHTAVSFWRADVLKRLLHGQKKKEIRKKKKKKWGVLMGLMIFATYAASVPGLCVQNNEGKTPLQVSSPLILACFIASSFCLYRVTPLFSSSNPPPPPPPSVFPSISISFLSFSFLFHKVAHDLSRRADMELKLAEDNFDRMQANMAKLNPHMNSGMSAKLHRDVSLRYHLVFFVFFLKKKYEERS